MKNHEPFFKELRAMISYLRGRAILRDEMKKRERREMGWIYPSEIQGKTGQERKDVLDGKF